MEQALVVSNLVLWAIVVALCAVLFALVRQVGVLHARVAPAGALMVQSGPRIGEAAPLVAAADLAGAVRTVGGPDPQGRRTLLFFLSPTCPVCKTLLPALAALARGQEAGLRVVLASDGPRDDHAAFVREHHLDAFPYLVSGALGLAWQVGKLPYAALIDGAGIVRAKGLVNSREHLDSLFEADERGVASIQDYFARSTGAERSSDRTEVA
jgi:methylamine dehydrogenase accessory protein MauD